MHIPESDLGSFDDFLSYLRVRPVKASILENSIWKKTQFTGKWSNILLLLNRLMDIKFALRLKRLASRFPRDIDSKTPSGTTLVQFSNQIHAAFV